MRVVFLIDSLGAGGAERSTAALVPVLVRKGIECSVCVLESRRPGFEDELTAAGVDVTVLGAPNVASAVLPARRLLRRERADIVHTALFRADQVGRLAAIGTRTRVVSSLVNMPRLDRYGWESSVPAWKTSTVNLLDRVTGRCVTRFHAVTEGVASAFVESYRLPAGKVSVVERGRDAAVLNPIVDVAAVRESLGIREGQRILLALGRHERQKAYPDMIAAFAALDDPTTELLIAGREGDGTAELRAAIERHTDVESRIHVLGHREDVPDLLAAAHALVVASRFEGAAGVVLEAMAAGVPIVSTELAGLRGVLVDEQNALLVPAGRPDRLARALHRLLADDDLRGLLIERGRSDFDARFTLEGSADRMIAMYASVSEGHH